MKAEELVAGVLGLLGLTQIVFIGLKLLDIIHWSWIWVLSPIWIPVVLFIAGVCLCLVGIAIGSIFKKS